ncbi:hypothetical protein DH2020_045494 [Rehmannia glutinosa]|uniref:RNase H type-1 domain-containing protein n=1 Tax=Rehmannia glutinosa TaxID=99300 RepID=A0ABR0UER3_REHGL
MLNFGTKSTAQPQEILSYVVSLRRTSIFVKYGEFRGMQEDQLLNIIKWQKPTFSYPKCNIDASICRSSKQTGIGMVVRDDMGVFVVARCITFQGCYQIKEAEAIGVREALSWITNLGLKKVSFETDAKIVVDGLYSAVGGSEFDVILSECRQLSADEPDFSVMFVQREGNKVPHELAKRSFSFVSPLVWTCPPPCIINLLLDDISD